MYPDTLLEDIAWSFDDTTYGSLDEFVHAVSEYQVSLELDRDWKANEIVLDTSIISVLTEEIYDSNDEETDFTVEIKAEGSSLTRAELLYKLHNAFAEKLKTGYSLGDHHFFEGLELEEGSDGHYCCFLGS